MDLPFGDKLVNVKSLSDGSITCGCPICINEGGDKLKGHLKIYKNLAYNCIKYGNSDKEHSKKIYDYLYSDLPDSVLEEYKERRQNEQDKTGIIQYFDEALLTKLLPNNEYWIRRGVKESVLQRIGAGLASKNEKSKLSGRAVLPVRDRYNKLIGFSGRLIESNEFKPKYKHLVRNEGNKKHFIFPNVNISVPAMRRAQNVILVEGQGCSMCLMGHGYDNNLCLFGVHPFSPLLSLIISMNVGKIIIATNDEPSGVGNRAADRIKESLCNYFNEKDIVIHLPKAKDFLDSSALQMDQWLKEYREIISPINNEYK